MREFFRDAANIRNMILLGILLLIGGKRIVEVYQHPPEAATAFEALETETDAIRSTLRKLELHEAHDDSVALFNLCRESKSATKTEQVSVAECLEEYPTMLELGIVELNAMRRQP